MILVGGVAPAGYAWAFPRGGTRVRVGVGVIQPDVDDNPRALYEPVADALAEPLRGARTLELHTGRIPSAEPPGRLTADGLMVVGDSAAQSNPLLGEGIRHVIEAAWRAAPIAARALERPGVVPRERLAPLGAHGPPQPGRAWPLALRANHYVARTGRRRLGPGGRPDRPAAGGGRHAGAARRPAVAAVPAGHRCAPGRRLAWRVARPFALGGV